TLWSALASFARIPGARLVRGPDAVLVLSGTPYATFNNVIASNLAAGGSRARVRELLGAFAPDRLPVTWWVSDATRPSDLATTLVDLGLVRQEPEFAMALDLGRPTEAPALPPGVTIQPVRSADELDAWLGVMAAAFRWTDRRKAELFGSMYRSPRGEGQL